ncbi:MAG TPA: hypothetical protein VF868_11870 [Bacteroidia bacterium]|jgi:hypothetical protein
MKTFISLAIASILLLPSCKKSEIQDVQPINQVQGDAVEPQKTLETGENDIQHFGPEQEETQHY